jgi:KRAB domain-containing zinc finger protein
MQCQNTSFKANSSMEHLKKHSEAKSNKCSLCDFASSQASNMRRHLITHTGGKSNKCVQCEYQYSQAGNLWEKAKQCNQCQYTSIRADSLRTHLKTTMEKSRPYEPHGPVQKIIEPKEGKVYKFYEAHENKSF